MNPISKKAYALLHEGALALGEAERNGIPIDVAYCIEAREALEKRQTDIIDRLKGMKAGKYWKRAFGPSMKFGALEQLREVLADVYGLKVKGSLDKNVLSKIDNPFIRLLLEYRKVSKASSTYLEGIMKHVIEGKLHPSFNLHTVSTYRSSSSSPNFQNIPIRDPWVAELIRKAFIPSPGNRIVEADYSGIEVRVAACYHEDPRMLRYLKTGYDMHREMAAEVYMTSPDNVSKMMRYVAKNRFVFPAFYGSYFKQMAPDLWEGLFEFDLKTEQSASVLKHLEKKHISTYADFEEHIKEVEDNFWHKKFKVYDKWKKDWWEAYLKRGEFQTLTGFCCRGHMKRNECINYAIQGSAFHCLLWSFIEITKALKKYKMRSKLIGQIHDSIVADVVDAEFKDYIELITEISTKRILKHWDWIILPLEIEVEATEVDQNWYTKKGVVI